MRKNTKRNKNMDLEDYIYIRVGKKVKKHLKEVAESSGSNMTIWTRQLIMERLSEIEGSKP